MPRNKINAIRDWIKGMGLKRVKSHTINRRTTRINYYSLGSFGVYEEIPLDTNKDGKKEQKNRSRFISWTPWGIDFEVSSVNELSRAYQDSISYNPEMS
jgi:hypothetical protein